MSLALEKQSLKAYQQPVVHVQLLGQHSLLSWFLIAPGLPASHDIIRLGHEVP